MEENINVLMVIDVDNILIHVGSPDTFKNTLLADYVRKGCSFKLITYNEWKQLGATLYQPLPSPPQNPKLDNKANK